MIRFPDKRGDQLHVLKPTFPVKRTLRTLIFPTKEQQKNYTETSLWDKGVGDKVLQKIYSHRSSLQTNPIQVRMLRLKERSILSREGAILPQHSPEVNPS